MLPPPKPQLASSGAVVQAVPARRHRMYSAAELARLKEDPDRWIVPELIPKGGRTLVYGLGSSYKTSLCFDLAVAVAGNGNMLQQFPVDKHGHVLIVSTESNIHENSRRLKQHCRAHGISLDSLNLTYCQEPFYLDDKNDVVELAAWIEDLQPCMVMLDPLDSFFMGDESSAKETKPVRRAVDNLISTFGCAFVILHHTTKGKGNKLPRGSSAWFDWADAALYTEKKLVKLGLPERVPFLEVTAKKQRNGRTGRALSGIAVHNPLLNTFTFDIYEDKDKETAITSYWSRKAHELLVAQGVPQTADMISQALKIRPARTKGALEMLAVQGLAARDVFVERPWGQGGQRMRKVKAWRGVRRYTPADLSDMMIRAEQVEAERAAEVFEICPMLPEEATLPPPNLESPITLTTQTQPQVEPAGPAPGTM